MLIASECGEQQRLPMINQILFSIYTYFLAFSKWDLKSVFYMMQTEYGNKNYRFSHVKYHTSYKGTCTIMYDIIMP